MFYVGRTGGAYEFDKSFLKLNFRKCYFIRRVIDGTEDGKKHNRLESDDDGLIKSH